MARKQVWKMELKELKDKVVNKTLDRKFLVFECKDNFFIAKQYVERIAQNRGLSITYIDNLDECDYADSFLFDGLDTGKLYVYQTDKFEDLTHDNFDKFLDTIVLCKSVEGSVGLILEINNCCVEFPKAEEWQVMDYMIAKCPGVPTEKLHWLYEITKGDIYRINNELDKLDVFEKSEQNKVFDLINKEYGYSDLNPLTIFNLSNAFVKKDTETIKTILAEISNIDIEGTGLVTLLIRNIRNLVFVKMKQSIKPEDIGVTEKQLKGISYSARNYTSEQLIKLYHFLTEIDYKLKCGDLSLSNDRIVDYITCNYLGNI